MSSETLPRPTPTQPLTDPPAWITGLGYETPARLEVAAFRHIYANSDFIFKLSGPSHPDDVARRFTLDAEAHRILAADGVAVPRLVEARLDEPQLLVFDRLPSPATPALGDAEAVAALFASIHVDSWDLPATPYPHQLYGEDLEAGASRAYTVWGAAARRVWAVMEKLTPATAGRARLHGDTYTGNLFTSAGQVWATDLEFATSGCPEWDLAVFSLGHPDLADSVLTAYGDYDSELLWRMARLKLATRTAWAMWKGYPVGETRTRLDRLDRFAATRPSKISWN